MLPITSCHSFLPNKACFNAHPVAPGFLLSTISVVFIAWVVLYWFPWFNISEYIIPSKFLSPSSLFSPPSSQSPLQTSYSWGQQYINCLTHWFLHLSKCFIHNLTHSAWIQPTCNSCSGYGYLEHFFNVYFRQFICLTWYFCSHHIKCFQLIGSKVLKLVFPKAPFRFYDWSC